MLHTCVADGTPEAIKVGHVLFQSPILQLGSISEDKHFDQYKTTNTQTNNNATLNKRQHLTIPDHTYIHTFIY